MLSEKASRSYWDATDANRRMRASFDGRAKGVRHFGKRQLHKFFSHALSDVPAGARLLELGCGGSQFLPYFEREFGLAVSGIDYSETGCALARQLADAQNCAADIVCADFCDAPSRMKSAFDVVVSFGVLEHFGNTVEALALFATFLKPGGTMITSVPNLRGIPGAAQTVLHRGILQKHVVLSPAQLTTAHEEAGLRVKNWQYVLFLNFGALNPGNSKWPRTALWHGFRAVTGLVWAWESVVDPLPGNRFSSPYIFCVSKNGFMTN